MNAYTGTYIQIEKQKDKHILKYIEYVEEV